MRIFIVVVAVIGLLVIAVGIMRHLRGNWQERRADRQERVRTESSRSDQGVSRDTQQNPIHSGLGSGKYDRVVSSGGIERDYLLSVPKQYDPSRPMPLVLFLHGGGGGRYQAERDYGWTESAEVGNFIVAFPNGISRLRRGLLATWNAGNCCGRARDTNVDDVGFLKSVVADVSRDFNIDENRVFATGMSNGGMMSHRLACDAADVFAAVASVAGTDGMGQNCHPSRPISVMHIHAKDDTHVLYNGGAGEDVFRDPSQVADFTSVPDTVKLWVERDQLDPVPKRILETAGVFADLYTSAKTSAVFELVVTETGGHSWPGGKAVRGKVPSTAIRANDVIWDFFQQHPKE